MKKTLAILLALLMTATVALVSCENNGREPVGGDWDNDDEYEDGETDDESGDENESESDGESESNNDSSNTDIYGWTAKSDTVYAGVNLRLREDKSDTSKEICTIPFGASLSRSGTNGTWDEVTYNGNTGYVLHTWVSANGDDFLFNDVEEVTISLQAGKSVMFFKTPIHHGTDFETDSANVLCASGLTVANLKDIMNSDGTTVKTPLSLTKVGVSKSGNWVKVKITGLAKISETNKKECNGDVYYVRALAFNRGDINDTTWNNNSNTGDEGNVFG